MQSGHIIGMTSVNVIDELKDNSGKLAIGVPIDPYIASAHLLVRDHVFEEKARAYSEFVHRKDLHVVTGAILSRCDYLVTLDKKHLCNAKFKRKLSSEIIVVSPKELLSIIAV